MEVPEPKCHASTKSSHDETAWARELAASSAISSCSLPERPDAWSVHRLTQGDQIENNEAKPSTRYTPPIASICHHFIKRYKAKSV